MRRPSKPITRREIAAIHNFYGPAFGHDAVEIPAKRAKSRDLEHKEQVALMHWWRLQHKIFGLPEAALLAIPNEGRGRNRISGARLKAEGVRAGVSDMFLAVPRNGKAGAWIELKSKEGRATESQVAFSTDVAALGYEAQFCYGAGEAIEFIKTYLGARP